MTDRPGGQQSGPGDAGRSEAHAEEVLAQALRVMAGGGKSAVAPTPAVDQRTRRRLSTGQLVLLAAIIGLLIGIGGGFLSLML